MRSVGECFQNEVVTSQWDLTLTKLAIPQDGVKEREMVVNGRQFATGSALDPVRHGYIGCLTVPLPPLKYHVKVDSMEKRADMVINASSVEDRLLYQS
jgi:hypothetical protein